MSTLKVTNIQHPSASSAAFVLASDGTVSGTSSPGLIKVVPTSVSVGSGSGSVDANGAVTFTGASSVSLNGCFNSSYQNYKILINSTNASTGSMRVRLRSSGTDNTTNNYASQYVFGQIGGAGSGRVSDGFTTSWTTAQSSGATEINTDMVLFNPFAVAKTYFVAQSVVIYSPDYYYQTNGAAQSESLSFDGITFFTATNTITGTICVYGLRN